MYSVYHTLSQYFNEMFIVDKLKDMEMIVNNGHFNKVYFVFIVLVFAKIYIIHIETKNEIKVKEILDKSMNCIKECRDNYTKSLELNNDEYNVLRDDYNTLRDRYADVTDFTLNIVPLFERIYMKNETKY